MQNMTRELMRFFGSAPAALRGLALLLCLATFNTARGDTTNFTGDFAAAFWTAQPQGGTITFTNSDTELVLAGPDKPSTQTSSIDPITYDGPVSAGLVTDGTVQFDWEYDSPFGLNDAAYFAWTPPDGSPIQIPLAQGGGVSITNFFSMHLPQGATFEFVLFTETPANKTGGKFVVTSFQFTPDVPEPSTLSLLLGGAIVAMTIRRQRR